MKLVAQPKGLDGDHQNVLVEKPILDTPKGDEESPAKTRSPTAARPATTAEKHGRRIPGAPSFRRGMSWTLFGSTVHAGCQWLSLMVLAKLASPNKVGTFALALAISAPVYMLFNLQLRGIQATDAANRYSFNTIWGVRLASMSIALILLLSYAYMASDLELRATLSWIAVAKGTDSLSDAIHGRLQRHGRLDQIGKSLIFKGVASLAFLSLFFGLTGSLPIAASGLAVASLLSLLTFDLRALHSNSLVDLHSSTGLLPRPSLASSEVKSLMHSALPLGGTMMLVSLTTSIPRYFLEANSGRSELGIFAALAHLVAAGSLVVSAAAQTASPRLANLAWNKNFHEFRRLTRKLYALTLAITTAGILLSSLFGRFLLTVFFTPEYASALGALLILVLAGGFTFANSVTGYALTAVGAHKIQFPLSLIVALVSAMSSMVMIPQLSVQGAALSVLLASAFNFAVSRTVLSNSLRRMATL